MADAHTKHHDYHIIDPSPWPLIGSIGALFMAIGGIGWMQASPGQRIRPARHSAESNPWLFFIGLLVVLYTMFGWWGDTIKEAHQGHHTRSSRCICATA
jgi:cytochrome c oxidase subunit 3